MGDLGNLEVGADSTGTYQRNDTVLSMRGANSILGKAVVLHAGQDDLTSQPSGAADSRMACGVIEMNGSM
jgi:Cu-Zn family superoxide dismutase